MKKAKKLLINMLLMTATTLAIRTVGVTFSAYLYNKIGSVAIGIFSLIMSVYTLAITLATSGIRFTATRLVSEEMGRQNHAGVRKVIRSCLIYCLCFSTATGLLLFFSADFIGTNWLDDTRTILSLQILSAALPFLSVSAALNGYFTAVRKATRSSLIQIMDQFVSIGISVAALAILLPKGLEYACVALVLGAVVSEVVTCVLLGISYHIDKRRLTQTGETTGKYRSRLLKISLPIAFSAYARSGLSTLQNILIPKGLRKHGLSQDASYTAYGTLHGMVLPVLLYPASLLYALAELLIPELTECQVQGDHTRIHYIVERVFKLSFLFSVCAMGVLFYFSDDLGQIFKENNEVAFYIKLLAPLVLVMYMDAIVDGMLKGLGEQLNSMKYNVIDSALSVAMVYLLIPVYGIKGYVITVMVSEVVNFTLSLGRLVKITRLRIHLFDVIVKPLAAIACSAGACFVLLSPGHFTRQFFTEWFVLHIAVMCLLYVLFLFLCSCLKREDFKWFTGLFK